MLGAKRVMIALEWQQLISCEGKHFLIPPSMLAGFEKECDVCCEGLIWPLVMLWLEGWQAYQQTWPWILRDFQTLQLPFYLTMWFQRKEILVSCYVSLNWWITDITWPWSVDIFFSLKLIWTFIRLPEFTWMLLNSSLDNGSVSAAY